MTEAHTVSSETTEITRTQRVIDSLNIVYSLVHERDESNNGYPADAAGVRLAIATASDHLEAALDAYLTYRLTSNWAPVKQELAACAATLVRIMREL